MKIIVYHWFGQYVVTFNRIKLFGQCRHASKKKETFIQNLEVAGNREFNMDMFYDVSLTDIFRKFTDFASCKDIQTKLQDSIKKSIFLKD